MALDSADETENDKAITPEALNWFDHATRWDNFDVNDSEYSLTNGKLVKFELKTTDLAYPTLTFDEPENLSKTYVAFSYYIDDPNGNITYLLMRIRTNANGDDYTIENLPYSHGYHYVEFDLENGTRKRNNADATNITSIYLNLPHTTTNLILYIDSIRFIKNHTTPRVILSFDIWIYRSLYQCTLYSQK